MLIHHDTDCVNTVHQYSAHQTVHVVISTHDTVTTLSGYVAAISASVYRPPNKIVPGMLMPDRMPALKMTTAV